MSSETNARLYELVLKLPAGADDHLAGVLSSCFEDTAIAVSAIRENHHYQGAWEIHWLFDHRPDPAELQARFAIMQTLAVIPLDKPVLQDVPDINWLEHCYKQLPPFSVGRFFIHGSHCEDPVPAGQTGIEINAATAFGTGEHPTTAACLQLLDTHATNAYKPQNILDMGCGSGILAIAAAKLFDAPVLAVDIEEESVAMTRDNAAKNNIPADRIHTLRCDGFKEPLVSKKGPYDLIFANILAVTLIDIVDDLCAALEPGGYTILSGLLTEQREKVLCAYQERGLILDDARTIKEWDALLMHRAP